MIVGATSSALADVSNGDVFERISAVGDLADGDEIIFVNQDETYACGTTQNTNNRTPVSIDVTDHKYTYKSSDNVQVFVVKINGSGNFGFHTGSGYIYSASTSSNYLKTNTSAITTAPGTTSAWDLTVSSYVFTVKNQTNTSYYLAFNGTSYFSQYKSGQSKPYIFKKQVAPAATLESIALSGTYPTTFHQGDAFSHEGMTVTATYDDDSEEDVTANATFSGYNMNETGDQTVTVSYTENEVTKTAEYGITVSAPATLSTISLSGDYQTVFTEGDEFNHEGLVVTANYDDDTHIVVTSDAVFSTPDMNEVGTQTITVTYGGKTTTYDITVNALPKYTVTFSDGGSETQASYGASVTLPSRSEIAGYAFAGWSETNVDEETTTAPTIIPAGSYTPTTNITLYPVYTKTEGGGGSQNETASVTISAYATANDWSNGNAYQPLNVDANISVGGEVSGNNFKYYTSDSSWRFYTGGSFTITANNGATLSSVTLTISSGTLKYGETTLKSGTAFDVTGNSAIISCTANAKITAISVDYTIAGAGTTYYWSAPVAAAVEKPTITVAENPFLFSTTATITCETEDAAIKYSYDNENWNNYSEALTITATTTIYAKAVKDVNESTVASVTATKNLAENTITVTGGTEQTIDLGQDEYELELTASATNGATVTFTIDNENSTLTEDDDFLLDGNIIEVYSDNLGVIVIKANADGDDDYAAATEATITITVDNSMLPGRAGNPYTVAQARTAIDAGEGITNVYATGIVSQAGTVNGSGQISYYISADGLTTSDQLQAYRGKGIGGANFVNDNDIQVGDVVVIYGTLKKYNSTYEFDQNNQLVSLVRKVESDLALTSDDEVELEITSANINPTSTIEWSTSSEGAMTFTSSNESVATVTNAGVITAVGEGEATITFSQAADEAYKASTNKTVTVTVNDNRSAVATGIDLTSAKTINLDEEGVLTATSTKTDGFTGEITYSYVSGDEDILLIDDADYVACGVGTTTITITATPTGGNAANYKSASQVVNVQVNGTNSINLDLASKTQVYSAGAFNIAATVPTANYDGVVTAESNNENVATVSVNGTTVTVTPKAVGSATITVTAGTGTYYTATASETCAVTISAPEGKETAPSADVTETFDFSKNGWSLPTSSSSLSGEYTKDGQTVTISGTGYYYGSKALLLGKSGAYITLPAFSKPVTQIDVVGVEGASGSVKQNIYVDSEAVSTETIGANGITNEYEIDSEYQNAGTIYTLKVTSAHNTQIGSIVVHMNQDPSETVTINKYGYATYCSVNPMDFSETEGYTAWYVSHITSDGVITFNKITGTIKGGQGVLLYNIDADGENTSNVNVKFASSDYVLGDNKLVGTTAPTYVEETGSVYGLSGYSFKKNSAAGTIGANKAYLDADDIPNEVQAFTFVFEDDETGITETRTVTREEVESIFNLAGQRLNRTQKGINIVNGKKVFIKK